MIRKLFFLNIVIFVFLNLNNLKSENDYYYDSNNNLVLNTGGKTGKGYRCQYSHGEADLWNMAESRECYSVLNQSQIAVLKTPNTINAGIKYFTPEEINFLSNDAWGLITSETIKTFTLQQISGIRPEKISRLTNGQIQAFTVDQIKALTTTQISAFTTTQVAALSPSQTAALTTSHISALTLSQVSEIRLDSLSPEQVASLTTSQLSALSSTKIATVSNMLTPNQVSSISPSQLGSINIESLTIRQLSALTATQIPGLSIAQILALTADKIAALTTTPINQIAALTVDQIKALTEAQIRGFTTTPINQIAAITPDQIFNFSVTQIKAFTSEQFLTLASPQIARINAQCLPEIINQLNNTQLSGLTTAQIISLPADKLSAFIIARDISYLRTTVIPAISTRLDKVTALTIEAQNKIKPYLNSNQLLEEIFKASLVDQTSALDVLDLLKRVVYLKAEYYVSSDLTYQKLLDLSVKVLGAITDPAQSSGGKIKTYEDSILNKSGDSSFYFWYSLLLDYPSTKDYVNLFLDISTRTTLTANSLLLINNIVTALNPQDQSSKNFRLSQLYCFDSSKTLSNTSKLLSQAKTVIESTLRTSSVVGTISSLPSSSDLRTTTTDFLVSRKNELDENKTEGLWDNSKLSQLYSAAIAPGAVKPSPLDTGKLMSIFSFWSFIKQWNNLSIRFDFEKYKLLSIISYFNSSVRSIFNSMMANSQANVSPQMYLLRNVLDDVSNETTKINLLKTVSVAQTTTAAQPSVSPAAEPSVSPAVQSQTTTKPTTTRMPPINILSTGQKIW